MTIFITLAIYIIGVWAAFFQIHHWSQKEVKDGDEYQTLFMLSMLSWLIYPLYGLVWLIRKGKEE